MSDEETKMKHSKRIHKELNAIHKQQKIAMQNGISRYEVESEPHRYSKHHAMDCGNPGCPLCGNRRRAFNELTIQEKRMFQDEEHHAYHGVDEEDTELSKP